jgi:hypothetical protein
MSIVNSHQSSWLGTGVEGPHECPQLSGDASMLNILPQTAATALRPATQEARSGGIPTLNA